MEALETVFQISKIIYIDFIKILYHYRRHSAGSQDLPWPDLFWTVMSLKYKKILHHLT